MSILGQIRLKLLSRKTSKERIRQQIGTASGPMREKFVAIILATISGYRSALCETHIPYLVKELESGDKAFEPWRFEGAAAGLALLDLPTPWKKNRWQSLLRHTKNRYLHILHAGAGLAAQKYPLSINLMTHIKQFDPFYRFFVIDGFGMIRCVRLAFTGKDIHSIPRQIKGNLKYPYDNGIGRSIWFTQFGEIKKVAQVIHTFEPDRQGYLWIGVGFALAYSGSEVIDDLTLDFIAQLPKTAQVSIASGVFLAAESRVREAYFPPEFEVICQRLTGMAPKASYQMAQTLFQNVASETKVLTAYFSFHQALRKHFEKVL